MTEQSQRESLRAKVALGDVQAMVELAGRLLQDALRSAPQGIPLSAARASVAGDADAEVAFDEAEVLLRRASAAGHVNAIAQLVHLFGLTPAEENKLLDGAGALQNPDALFTRGLNLADEDPDASKTLMLQAADLGGSQAILVSVNLMTTLGDPDSRLLAREILERVASATESAFSSHAKVDLAFLLHEEDPTRAKALLEAAGSEGHPDAPSLYDRWTTGP